MNGRPPQLSPPQLSPLRLVAGVLLPLAAYWVLRSLLGSVAGALAITTAVPAIWLIGVWIVRRRVDPIGVVVLVTTVVAFVAFVLSGGDPLALELRRGAVTGPIGIAALVSVALRRPLLLLIAEGVAKANPERAPEIEARLAEPRRRRSLAVLTFIIGATLTLDGASQIVLALTVPSGSFVADATAARIAVLGVGFVLAAWYVRFRTGQLRHGTRWPST